MWADEDTDATAALERDELDLTVQGPRPTGQQPTGPAPVDGELGDDPSPPVDRL